MSDRKRYRTFDTNSGKYIQVTIEDDRLERSVGIALRTTSTTRLQY